MIAIEPKSKTTPIVLWQRSAAWAYDVRYRLWNLRDVLRFAANDWNEVIQQLEILRNPLNTDILAAAVHGIKEPLLGPLRKIHSACVSLQLNHAVRITEILIADVELSQTPLEEWGAKAAREREKERSPMVHPEDIYNPIHPKRRDKTLDTINFQAKIVQLQQSIELSLELVDFVVIEHNKRAYLIDPYLFGVVVADKFPSAVVDIEEAGKCFAFNRYTACVFHLMRVLEVGLRALGASLKDQSLDPTKNPSWERILGHCDDELKKPYKDRSPEWNADAAFFSEATANLRSVKDAWRNPTMHVDIVYDEERASEVWNASKAFMRHLSSRLSQI